MAEVVSLRPEKSEMDKLVDALFQVLPCHSHKEIARKLSKYMGRRITTRTTGQIILHLRRNCQRYGWTVPHAQSGHQAKEQKGECRFFHVLVEKGRDPEFDVEHETQLNNGVISTISHAASSMQHESEAITLAAAYCGSPGAKKWMRSLGRRMKQIGEDAGEILGMLNENGGAA